jgi:hypothetical protein
MRPLGILPALIATGWLVYGLIQMGSFQKQERVWRSALDRATLLAVINFGLSPFLYWWSRIPTHLFFLVMVVVLALSGLLFLANVNLVLRRLGAMLPDEALRLEIKQFTTLNLNLLGFLLVAVLGAGFLLFWNGQDLPLWLKVARTVMDRTLIWLLIPLLLLPLAMTMALLWKTKEVILESVFAAKN